MLPHVSKMDSKPVHDRIELLLRSEVPLLEYRERSGILPGSFVVHIDHEPGEELSDESGQRTHSSTCKIHTEIRSFCSNEWPE